MKKYYCITLFAVLAIFLLQVIYVVSLYNHYVDENIIGIDMSMRISIDKERHLRSLRKEKRATRSQQYVRVKSMKDLSPKEMDSLKRLPQDERESISVDAARAKGIAETSGELILQILEDGLMEDGFFLNENVLDSIFNKLRKNDTPHVILLYNSNKELLTSVGKLKSSPPDYSSKLIPIGTKGLRYLQVKADIPLLPFIENQVWALILSVILMIFVVACMAYHLTVIRRKEKLLQKREDSINGTIHDLKAPLNSVLAVLGWLQSDETNQPKKKAVEISSAEVRHLVCNIESLLVTVRRDRKRLILKKGEIDILYLVEMVKSSMDALYRTKPHTIEIMNELPVGVKVIADGLYIENVIRNLVENTLKYSDDGVIVKVTLSVVSDMLQVSVEDNGWGIAPQHQKKLFQQFYQVPRGEERICKGYGIGLAQSKYIIDEHKGKINVKSTENKGSIFTFTIPLSN